MQLFDQLAEVIGSTKADWIGKVAAAERVLEAFVVIPKADLPDVWESEHDNGLCAATAQEFYQPELRFNPADGDKPGQWNRKIAYANLAVAHAIEARDVADAQWRQKRRDELASEFTAVNSYNGQLPYTQKLIDRIISLEEAAK